MKSYTIYLDMDGVLTDWVGKFKQLSNGIDSEDYKQRYGEKAYYDLVDSVGERFYSQLEWLPDGKQIVDYLKDYPAIILSSGPTEYAQVGKKIWLKNNNIPFKAIIVSNKKYKADYANNNSILIDDDIDNINNFRKAGGIGVLHKNAKDTIEQLKQIPNLEKRWYIENTTLNPEFWNGKVLKSEIQQKLLQHAKYFYKETELQSPIVDIIMVGSSAGYNWTSTSDIDLHIVSDFKQINTDTNLVKNYVNVLRTSWNEKHNIKINNHEVEVYIQDINHPNRSHGIYSILKNTWIKEPDFEGVNLDKNEILKIYRDYKAQIEAAISTKNPNIMKDLTKKITDYRNDGLATHGEFSIPNIVYKLLRRRNDMKKLYDSMNAAIDTKLSITV